MTQNEYLENLKKLTPGYIIAIFSVVETFILFFKDIFFFGENTEVIIRNRIIGIFIVIGIGIAAIWYADIFKEKPNWKYTLAAIVSSTLYLSVSFLIILEFASEILSLITSAVIFALMFILAKFRRKIWLEIYSYDRDNERWKIIDASEPELLSDKDKTSNVYFNKEKILSLFVRMGLVRPTEAPYEFDFEGYKITFEEHRDHWVYVIVEALLHDNFRNALILIDKNKCNVGINIAMGPKADTKSIEDHREYKTKSNEIINQYKNKINKLENDFKNEFEKISS